MPAYWGPPQDVNLIPLLAPLALIAYQGALALRRGAAGALDWFGVLGFGFFAALVWIGWFAMLTGLPPRLANNFSKSAPAFALEFKLMPVLLALALTLGWLYLVFFTTRSPMRSVLRWAVGHRAAVGHVRHAVDAVGRLPEELPLGGAAAALEDPGRRAAAWRRRALGVSQAAALDYHGGIRARPFDIVRPNACPLLLVQGSPQHEFDGPGTGWVKLADVGRPGDRGERYRLYRLQKMNTRSPVECPSWAQARAARRELARRAPARPVRRRRRAQPPVRRRSARRALRLLAPAPRRDDRCACSPTSPPSADLPNGARRCSPASAINTTEKRAGVAHGAARRRRGAPRRCTERSAHEAAGRQRCERKELPAASSISAPAARTSVRAWSPTRCGDGALDVRFVANVDPHDLERALEGAEPASTLFVVVSKTFTTQETMANAARAPSQWGATGTSIAVTANTQAAKAFGAAEILPMWDWVGGRFSVWSAVGLRRCMRDRLRALRGVSRGAHDVDLALRATRRSSRTCRR